MSQLIHDYELHFLVGEKAGTQVAEKPIPISQGGDLEDVLRKDFFYLILISIPLSQGGDLEEILSKDFFPGKPLVQITHPLYHAKFRSGP